MESVFPFEKYLSPAGQALVAKSKRQITVQKGERLYDEGELCDRLIVIHQGAISVFREGIDRGRIDLYTLTPNHLCVLGLHCLVTDSETYMSAAEATTDLNLWSLPAAVFRRLYQSESRLQKYCNDYLARTLAEVLAKVDPSQRDRVEARLSRFLLAQEPGEALPLTHDEIAQRIGTVREVVSRCLNRLKERQAVDLGRRSIRVLDRKILEEFL